MELNENTIKNIIKKVLNEGVFDVNRKSVIKSAYNQIVNAVSGVGTNTNKILEGINLLKNGDEFRYLLSFFKDKRTGYSDFSTMINEEYDRFNFNDIIILKNKLKLIGVNSTFQEASNAFGTKHFSGGFKITDILTKKDQDFLKSYYPRINNACKVKWQNQLQRAVTFWKNWLNDPITIKKVEKNWEEESNFLSIYSGYLGVTSNIAWAKYKDSLDNLKLFFYDYTKAYLGQQDLMHNAYAFVNPTKSRYNIYINCTQDDPDPYGTLVHEIQHIIYGIKPLNPDKKINDVFVNSKTIKQTEQKIKSSLPTNVVNKSSSNITNAAKNTGLTVDIINDWKTTLDTVLRTKSDIGYICRETEKMSNIMSIRKTLNVAPGGNITYNMLKPYITKQKNNGDIYWFLLCWAKNGFPDINQMLNKVNKLAFNQNKKTNQSGTNLV